MSGNTTTTNMGLLLPTVQDDLNAWGGDLNTSLSTVDTHDHSPGKGVQVPSAGININANLSLAQFSLTNIRQLSFYDPASTVSAINQVYVKSGNLFYNDGSGNQIQITTGGGVAGAAGNITGMGAGDSIVLTHATGKLSFNSLSGSANMILQAAEYQAGTQYTFGVGGTPNLTFASSQFSFNNGSAGNGNLLYSKWNVDTNDSVDFTLGTTTFNFNTASGSGLGNIKAKLHKISEPTTGTNAVSLAAPPGLASSYTATMPAALPGSKKILTLDSSGNIDDTYDVDNSTLTVTSNTLAIKANGVTRTNLAAVGQQVSSSCSSPNNVTSLTFTDVPNLSVTITTTGRPVILCIQPDGTGNVGVFEAVGPNGVSTSFGAQALVRLLRGATEISRTLTSNTITVPGSSAGGHTTIVVPASAVFIDVPAAGTYTYKVQICSDGTSTAVFNNCVFVGYEL